MARPRISGKKMEGARVLILTGQHKGEQAVCLGEAEGAGLWAISPDNSDEILSLRFEKDFGLLIDLSSDPTRN
jgi:hypothetical protein